MRKPFDAIYASLQKELEHLDGDLAPIDRYGRAVALIAGRITEVRALGAKAVGTKAGEVEYFRDVWPAFYGALFLYARLHRFHINYFSLAAVSLRVLIERELRRVAAFFRCNREFWMYYRSGSGVMDEQFTREYSRTRVLEPLSQVLDPEGATLASYRAAWCRAMEGYGAWLAEERDRLESPRGGSGDYTWAAADTDYVEWIFGLQAVGAIKYKGQVADTNRLAKWGKWALNKEVVNMHDRFKVLRNRKKERMVFTKKTEAMLGVDMDAKEGKKVR